MEICKDRAQVGDKQTGLPQSRGQRSARNEHRCMEPMETCCSWTHCDAVVAWLWCSHEKCSFWRDVTGCWVRMRTSDTIRNRTQSKIGNAFWVLAAGSSQSKCRQLTNLQRQALVPACNICRRCSRCICRTLCSMSTVRRGSSQRIKTGAHKQA